MGLREDGTSFVNRILEHVDAAQREAVSAALLGNQTLLERLGADAAAVAAAGDDRANLNAWYEKNKAALQEAVPLLKAKAEGRLKLIDQPEADDDDPLDLTGGRRRAPQPAGLSETEVQSRIAAAVNEATARTQTEGLALINKMTRIGLSHMQEFNQVLDTDALTDFAVKNNLRLDIAYDKFVETERGKRSTEQRTKELQDAEERGKKAGREEAFNRTVPVPPGSASTSTLSGLTDTGKVDASMSALRQALHEATTGTGQA